MRSCALVLFTCAGLLLSGGTILGGTVAWSLLRMSYYFWTCDLGVELASAILFIGASVLCLPICWLSTLVPYHTKSMSMNAALMGVVSVAVLLMSLGNSSLSALSRAIREPSALNNSMLRTMAIDAFDPAVRSSFAAMQIQRNDICQVPLFSTGCLRPAITELRYFVNTLSALSSALIIVMAVTLFAAAYMMVINEVERNKVRTFKTSNSGQLRIGIACLSQAPPSGQQRVAFVQPAIQPIANTP